MTAGMLVGNISCMGCAQRAALCVYMVSIGILHVVGARGLGIHC